MSRQCDISRLICCLRATCSLLALAEQPAKGVGGLQAMQQWGGQQWQGGVAPLGLPQGWMRPYPMGMAPAGPLQIGPMPSRQPLQGTVSFALL